ncbi:hypothetical protein K458DRAFT_410610 [Lentithecium fluviatile CBS 122367]|uniref:Uncharacterized protein n=1 Tax=Lentithecium fluviatile CBS 122367 TaxID=1168545 RepID=A0A6G1IDE8_9PLEO|nr:hypothetical protein K458DRAFT_410610 [Lentithecium fluviatile CBS 122367]
MVDGTKPSPSSPKCGGLLLAAVVAGSRVSKSRAMYKRGCARDGNNLAAYSSSLCLPRLIPDAADPRRRWILVGRRANGHRDARQVEVSPPGGKTIFLLDFAAKLCDVDIRGSGMMMFNTTIVAEADSVESRSFTPQIKSSGYICWRCWCLGHSRPWLYTWRFIADFIEIHSASNSEVPNRKSNKAPADTLSERKSPFGTIHAPEKVRSRTGKRRLVDDVLLQPENDPGISSPGHSNGATNVNLSSPDAVHDDAALTVLNPPRSESIMERPVPPASETSGALTIPDA